MARLRTVSARQPGWTRVRHGRGFRYVDQQQRPLTPDDVARVKALVIPPAWRGVWISPYPNGHLQAVGTDEAGRRQYLYHPVWREQRDAAKFDRVIEMAGHRKPSARLLAHRDGRRWVPLQAAEVNEHIRDLFGLEVTAKDFRTWHATVHVAAALAEATAASSTARAKVVRSAVVSASELLGNTPTVCRGSYVDPRVIDLYESEVTVAGLIKRKARDPDRARDQLDRAVVKLLTS